MAAKSAPQFYYSGTFFTAAAVAGGLGSSLRGKKKCSGETVRGRFQSPPVALFPTSRIGTSAVGNVQGGRWLWRAAPHRYRGGERAWEFVRFFFVWLHAEIRISLSRRAFVVNRMTVW